VIVAFVAKAIELETVAKAYQRYDILFKANVGSPSATAPTTAAATAAAAADTSARPTSAAAYMSSARPTSAAADMSSTTTTPVGPLRPTATRWPREIRRASITEARLASVGEVLSFAAVAGVEPISTWPSLSLCFPEVGSPALNSRLLATTLL